MTHGACAASPSGPSSEGGKIGPWRSHETPSVEVAWAIPICSPSSAAKNRWNRRSCSSTHGWLAATSPGIGWSTGPNRSHDAPFSEMAARIEARRPFSDPS